MAVRRIWVLLLPLLAGSCTARPDGPPLQACFTMAPQHGSNLAQTSPSPVTFSWNRSLSANTVILPGQYIEVSLEAAAGENFKGFMIQARAGTGAELQLVGTFLQRDGYQTLGCSKPADTAAHVNNNTKPFIRALWMAPEELPDEFSFFYTVVESFDRFWVMQESPGKLLGRVPPLPGNEMLIKIHGSLMSIAWGVLIPIGIILALFYKVVWPNGHWFYIHISVMVVGILMVIAGLFVILAHAEWKWLDTTDLNYSHQVLGIIALSAVVVNPFLGLFLLLEGCSLGTKWRTVYNICHGGIGIVFAEGAALCAMLVGVHILRDHPRDFDEGVVHSCIYSVSAIAGTVIMIIALYNGYHTRYHKEHPKPDAFEEDPKHSKDWWVRLVVGCGLILLLLAPVVSTIYYLFNI
jgi:hypothetical protein